MPGGDRTGPEGHGPMTGARRGGFARGPGGECLCPKCGYLEPHKLGDPCYAKKCPKCGAILARKE